jgi:hypothetical protein
VGNAPNNCRSNEEDDQTKTDGKRDSHGLSKSRRSAPVTAYRRSMMVALAMPPPSHIV